MRDLETSRHLFQRPLYCCPSGDWTYSFPEALQHCGSDVHLDMSAVVSCLSFGVPCQDRTLLQEITRRPWLSRVTTENQVILEAIPPHGFITDSDENLAKRLYDLLCNEARTVCEGFNEIYILLSGGLDSRIIAGVLAKLHQQGDISAKPIAVTWGLPDSRDVVYASQMARMLGIEWQHIELGWQTVLQNIDATAYQLGLLHSPEMLHNMLWFKRIPPTALVLAASFGDSIGRAEFSGQHLLELRRRQPQNMYELLKPAIFRTASMGVIGDLDLTYSRAQGNVPPYARYEHWMQANYMRGGLCHALSIINNYARIYQMFTAPDVYGFMWSLHPTRRDDEIYAALLENELPGLARIPWPRTNRAFRGGTIGAGRHLRRDYHEYTRWSSGPLYFQLCKRIDPEWFEATGIFDALRIRKMNELVRASKVRVGVLNYVWLWLAGFRTFVECLESKGKSLIIEPNETAEAFPGIARKKPSRGIWVLTASKCQFVNSTLKGARRFYRKTRLRRLKRDAVEKYPPIPARTMIQHH